MFGCGPIGLLVLQVARLFGGRLFATDLASRSHRLEAARALGATVFAAEDGREGGAIRDAAGAGGLDVAFEAAGVNAAVDAAVEAVRPGARVVLAGIPSEARTSFVAGTARRKGLTFVLSRRMGDVYPRAIQLVAGGHVDVRSLVTHRFPLEQIAAGYDAAIRRLGHKVDHRALTFSDSPSLKNTHSPSSLGAVRSSRPSPLRSATLYCRPSATPSPGAAIVWRVNRDAARSHR